MNYSHRQVHKNSFKKRRTPHKKISNPETGPDFSAVNNESKFSYPLRLFKNDFSDSLHKELYMLVSHIVSPEEFYVHIVCEDNTCIDHLRTIMFEYYSVTKIRFSSKKEAKRNIGMYCACLYPEDNMWYRAQVIDWRDESPGRISVFYVDYGNMMMVNLRMIQPLYPSFAKYPIFAQLCNLSYVCPSSSKGMWSTESVNAFKKFVPDDDLHKMIAIESAPNNGSLGVLLFNPKLNKKVSINEYMVDRGFAHKLTKEFVMQQKKDRELDAWDPMKEDFYSETNVPEYDDENACLAVSGYNPKDESRVCKSFSKKGNCSMGSNCGYRHIFTHPDGWTTDRQAVYTDMFNILSLPCEGEKVHLIINEVRNVKSFYANIKVSSRISPKDGKKEQKYTLQSLQRAINTREKIKKFRRPIVTPALGQLVLAQCSRDQQWYRARVIDTNNDEGLVEIFFVDYGDKDTVYERFIREIENPYLHLPPQAVECFISNVDINHSVDGDEISPALSFVKSLILHKTISAVVTAKCEEVGQLEVLLKNHDNIDIGSMIVEKNLDLTKTSEICSTKPFDTNCTLSERLKCMNVMPG